MSISHTIKKGFFSLVSSFFIIMPLSAEIITDTNAAQNNQAQVTTSANGVPMVNIVTPNTNGLSHNKFLQYNVSKDHLILNNSQNAVNTTISGTVQANPNFNGQSASIILNEVTGNNRSMLQGYTEIAGSSAELVIANPNGITCEGCGFINTPRVVLSTGMPVISNQQLMSLSVNQGNITLSGDTVNTGNVDQFELITRSVIVDTQLIASGLNLITGTNSVNYKTLETTPIQANSNEAVPVYAIDSAALGGMYANTIKLIATEQGIGVKLDASMATNTGDITLNADGSISIKSASSAQNVDIKSTSGDISTTELLYAADKLSLTALGDISNTGLIAATTSIETDSGTLHNQQDIIAGLKPDQSYNTTGRIHLKGTELFNQGQMIATDRVTLSADLIDNQSGKVEALSSNVELNYVLSLDNTLGRIKAANDINIKTGHYQAVTLHGLEASSNLNITAYDFTNNTDFNVASNLNINLGNHFENSGSLQTIGYFKISAQSVKNTIAGQIKSDGNINVIAQGNVLNESLISGKANVEIFAQNISNQGVLASGDRLTLNAQQGVLNGTDSANPALLFSVGNMALYGDTVTNLYADIYSLGDINIAKNAQGDANSLVLNSSAGIESIGNINIITQLMKNKRHAINTVDNSSLCDGFVAAPALINPCLESTTGMSGVGIPDGTPLTSAWLFEEGLSLNSFGLINPAIFLGLNNGLSILNQRLNDQYKIIYGIMNRVFEAAVKTPTILAGGNLTITAGSMLNQAGELSAGQNITIEANDFYNESIFAYLPYPVPMTRFLRTSFTFALPSNFEFYNYVGLTTDSISGKTLFAGQFLDGDPRIVEYEDNLVKLQNDYLIVKHPNISLFYNDGNGDFGKKAYLADFALFSASIQAGNSININATNSINLGVNNLAAVTGSTPPLVTVPDVSSNISANTPGSDTANIIVSTPVVNNTNTFAEINNAIPDASNFVGVSVNTNVPTNSGLFSETNSINYLVATNASVSQFIDIKGSDYLLEQLNYQPEILTKRLGDGFYENYLIREAIKKQTGQRFLHESIKSDKEQFEYLMNNAVTSAKALNLAVGVSLTGQQVASLTHDMMWLEEKLIKGEKVLVPVLYLATVRPDDVSETGLIHAQNINLNTKSLSNSFNMVAEQGLSIQTKNSLNNKANLNTGGNLTLASLGAINNTATLTSGRTLFIKTGGSFSSKGKGNQLNSQQDIIINAGSNISLNQSAISAGSGINVQAIKGVTLNKSQLTSGQNVLLTGTDVVLDNSTLQAKGNLAIAATGALSSQQTQLSAQQGMALSAQKDITISNSQLGSNNDLSITTKGQYNSVNSQLSATQQKTATNEAASIILNATKGINNRNSQLSAGSLVQIADQGDINNDETTTLKADQNIYFKAAGDITTWDNLKVANDITLDAGRDLNNRGKSLEAGNDITLNAKRDINIEALKNTQTDIQSNMQERYVRNAGKQNIGEKTTTTTTKHTASKLIAGGNIALNSGRNISVIGSEIEAKGDVSLMAKNNINISSAQDEITSTTLINTVSRESSNNGDYDEGTVNTSSSSTQVNSLLNSSLKSGGNLILEAGSNILSKGAALSAAKAIGLKAGDSITLDTQTLKNHKGNAGYAKNIFEYKARRGTANEQSDTTTQTATTLNAGTGITLIANKDITVTGSDVTAKGSINVDAGRHFTLQRANNTKDTSTTTYEKYSEEDGDYIDFKTQQKRINTAKNSTFSAGDNINITTGENTTLNGQTLTAGNNIAINAQGNILLDSVTDSTSQGVKNSNQYSEQTLHTTSKLNAGNNISLNSAKNITLKGSQLNGNQIALNATGDINIDNVQNEAYNYKRTRKSGFFSSSSTTTETLKRSNVESQLNAKGNITINTKINKDGSISQYKSGNVNITSSDLTAQNNVIIAGDNVNLLAQKELNHYDKKTKSSGFLGLSSSSSTTTRKDAILRKSKLNALTQDVTLQAQNNLKIVGADLNAKQDINLSGKNIDISAGYNEQFSETRKQSSSVLGGGNLYEQSSDLAGQLKQTAVNNQLNATNINLNAKNAITIIGTDLKAKDNINADGQSISIKNTQNSQSSVEEHQKLSLSLGDALGSLTRPDKLISGSNGTLAITLATIQYQDSDKASESTTSQASTLNAQSINLNARDGDITIQASDLNADNITLDASNDINIKNAINTSTTNSKDTQGTAELKITIKNEYDQAIRAAQAVDNAKDDLTRSQQALSDYQTTLNQQQTQIEQLQAQVDNGSSSVSQSDVNQLQNYINRLKKDEDYYKTNIVLATSTLATKTTAAAAQMAKAAASSTTYGFNIGAELDINAVTEQLNNQTQSSTASTLNANTLTINAGNTTRIQGSNLNANDTLAINSQDLIISAAQTNNRQSSSTEEENITLSMDVYGGTGLKEMEGLNNLNNLSNLNANASNNQNSSQSQSTNYTNSQLNADNISINVRNNTTIKGGNINAKGQLNLNTKNLTLESQQNTQQSTGSSQGINVAGGASGLSSGGINNGNNQSNSRQTQLSSITGQNVNINVQDHTQITGALIASQNPDGTDANNLNLSTHTITTASLSNTHQSNSLNQSIGAGSTLSLDYNNTQQNSLSKTQATIGEGNLTITDTANSDTTTLNRDINNVEVEIYDIQSNQGLSGSLDTNLLTQTGRSKIKEDILKSGMIVNTISNIIKEDNIGIEDFFKETEKSHTTYESIKAEIRKDPQLAKALQDPSLNADQKKDMLDQITRAVMTELGYLKAENYDNNIINTNETGKNDEQIAGFYSEETKDAYINDQNMGNTNGLLTVAGHEASHALDDQTGDNNSDAYATNFGENLASYTDTALDVNGYDGGLADTNNHTGNDSEIVQQNNQDFATLDKDKGDNYCSGGYNCYGEQTEQILRTAKINPQPIETLRQYQIRERINAQGIVVGYEAYNQETKVSIIMLPQELNDFKEIVNKVPQVASIIENDNNANQTIMNAHNGLYGDGGLIDGTIGTLDGTIQALNDPVTLVGTGLGLAGGKVLRFVPSKIVREGAPPKDTNVKWVDENASMSDRARNYDDSATGSRSNIESQLGQAPAIQRTLSDGTKRNVKFDGFDGNVLIDRKISVVTTAKAKDQVKRQSQALFENGLTGRWEVPTEAQAKRAQKMFDELGVKNIEVKIVPEQ